MNTPIRSFQVAAAGLDLLHHTRLKLACSLLLSERMDVAVRPWDGTPADLVVVHVDHPDSRGVLADANEAGIAALRVSRRATQALDGLLPHGAAVRDFNQQVRQLLGTTPATPMHEAPASSSAATPLLLQLANTAGEPQLHLLQRGAMWLLLDQHTRSIALPMQISLADVCAQLDATSWSAQRVDSADFQHQYAYRLPQRQSLEALYFAMAQYRPELLPAAPASLQLRHWPDLAAAEVPGAWLPAIARLHAGPCSLDTLAQHCHLPRATMASLFSAASACGLALSPESVLPSVSQSALGAGRAAPGDTPFLLRLARRFGLGLPRGHAA